MGFAMIGLGKMGANMVRRLARAGIRAAVFDRAPEARTALAAEVASTDCGSLAALVAATAAPRVVWMMLPAGAPTQSTIDALLPLLSKDDVLVDGANAWYRDTQARAAAIAARGVEFVDVGVSGGVWGLDNGYGLMAGGTASAINTLKPVLQALAPAPDRGWLHCGPLGAGHYCKMVHNGIEYGLMQAYAEGLSLLAAKRDLHLDVAKVAESWRHGTVIRSWLLDLTAEFLRRGESLDGIAPVVADSGEGRWTAREGIELGVPTPVMSLALMERFGSQGNSDYANRLLARMRQAFGGHATAPSGKA
jgi:6-phosphogluconate dehydrogenase